MAWRYCGNQLKLWRTYAGISREALAEEANYDAEYVKSMEQGRRRPTLRMLQVADQMCGAHGMLEAAQDFLKPERYPERTHEFMRIEAEAIAIHWYESLLIPGLLQTEEYARKLMAGHCPPLDDETIDARLAARLERQKVLTDKPTVLFNFIIYEAALWTMVGGAEVMKRQLDRLLEVAEARNVSVQVLPAGRPSSAALSGPLVLLETADHEVYSYVEAHGTSVLSAAADKTSSHSQRYGTIRMQALSEEETVEFIREAAKRL
ncbi:helix-turn-helix transcriptional regulator [Streptomyces sp. NPDC007100]|uniref:helix-turn-helix domain-containing protein n=1 Tax=Streptomyces sp. NPDC007100 TaxID=3155602 RepID=UPI0033F67B9A